MNKLKLIIFMSLMPFAVFSQVKIKGRILDLNDKPIEFAEITLLPKDSVAFKSEFSSENGYFDLEIKAGNYILSIRQLGNIFYKDTLNAIKNIDLGVIKVKNSNILDEVTVVSKKKLIERKGDKIIFNVEQSVVSQGVDAIEVLRRTPKIDISKGSIQLVGKSSLGVMVNDRLLNLSSVELEAYLKTIRSENISKIEVITTPPAKYDAEGNSGLINIVLKKNANLGWKGNISTTYSQRTYAGFVPASTIYYNSNKINLSFNLSGDMEAKRPISNSNIGYQNNYRNSFETRKESSKGLTSGFNLNYIINKKNELGIIYTANFWDTRQKGNNENKFYTKITNQVDSIQKSPFMNKNNYNYHSISSYYDLKIDSLGKKMSLNFNLLNKYNRNNRDFSTTNFLENNLNQTSFNSATNNSLSKYNVYSLNADFTLPFTFVNIETGSKITFIENNSKIAFFNNILNLPVFESSKSNEFDYKERVIAFYISANKEIADKWSAQIGLRYESTNTNGISKTLNTIQKNIFANLFPSAFITYDPNETNSFSLAYSKRIERPSFSEVNPFRVYSDFYSYESGNPNLLPAFTENIEFSYLVDNNLSITLYGSKLKQGRDYLTITKSNENSVISIPENYYNQNTIGLDISYTYEPTKWINSFNSFSSYYNNSKSYLKNITIPNFKGSGAYFDTKNTFTLNNKKTSFFVLNFFQSFPNTEGFLKSDTRASFDIGLKFTLLNENLQASILGNDLFAQNRNVGTETYPNYRYTTSIYNDMRNLTISLNFKFGNNKLKTNNKKIENIDETRL